MKRKLSVTLLFFLTLMLSVPIMAFASVGDNLPAPETGWKRVDSASLVPLSGGNLEPASGTVAHLYGGTAYYGKLVTKFKFTGSKFRIIASNWPNYSAAAPIWIDGVKYTFSFSSSGANKIVLFEKTDLTNDTHLVVLGDGIENINYDAFDFNSSSTVIQDYTPPSNVSGITNTVTDTTVSFQWTNPTDPDFNGVKIYEGSSLLTSLTKTATTYEKTGLTPTTGYTYTFKSVDTSENLSSGIPVTFTTTETPDTSAPAAPIGLSVTAGDGQAVLSWSANTDDAIKYHIYQNGVYLNTVTHPTTTYTVTGLKNQSIYSYSLNAEDAAGNVSTASITVRVTPSGPAPVTGITPGSTNFGFSGADIFLNSVNVFVFISGFILLGIVIDRVAPKVFELVRNSFK